jgi:hypothetical protein
MAKGTPCLASGKAPNLSPTGCGAGGNGSRGPRRCGRALKPFESGS